MSYLIFRSPSTSSTPTPTPTSTPTPTPTPISAPPGVIIIDGITYNEVVSPSTGRTWLDRNLGATEVAQTSGWPSAQGWLYQWGRLSDGHQLRGASYTSQTSSLDNPNSNLFFGNENSPFDWRVPQNNSLWQGVNGINNPGVSNFRLPTEAEWQEEINTWSSQDVDGGFNSILKLPKTGYRLSSGAGTVQIGSQGFYWTSSVRAQVGYNNSSCAQINDKYAPGGLSAGIVAADRARGMAVRLIKDIS